MQRRKEQFQEDAFHTKLLNLLVVCVGSRSFVLERISFTNIISAHLMYWIITLCACTALTPPLALSLSPPPPLPSLHKPLDLCFA